MVLSTRPLTDLCPVVPAAMEGRQIAQWDKDSCADAGFLKIDLLGLGMLSAVERTVTEIARVRSERIDLSRIPLDDAEVYRRIQAAETTGVFQIESRAQMQMLPRSRPENIEDLTVQVAIVRPGPIQGGAVHPYLERRKRLREDPDYEIPYEHPSLEPILSDTLGAIVFQDQVIQVAMALAGFSSGEAEGLRRAMSRKRSEEAMRSHRDRFVEGAVARGVSLEVAERVFSQIHGFSGFGFPKSHAAAFGLLAYQSTWLRVHYGPEFLCSLLNEQPMGFYPPDALVHEAQRRGIEVLGPDVNRSDVLCRVERVRPSRRRGEGSPRGADRARLRQGAVGPGRRGSSSPSGCGAVPTGSSVSSPRARAPGARGSSGSPGRAPAGARRESGAASGAIAGGCRSGGSASPAARSAVPRASSSPCRSPCPKAPGAAGADALGAGHGRLRRLRDLPGPPPALPAPRRAGPPTVTCEALQRSRRQRSRRGRATRRPAAPRHRQGGDVPADRGRDGGRQRDRHPAGLRTPSADGADRLAGHDRGPPRTPRGGHQRRRGERPPDRAPGRPARRRAHDRALPRERQETRKRTSATSTPSPRRPFLRPPRAMMRLLLARTCVRPGPFLSSRAMNSKTQTQRRHRHPTGFGVTAINRVADRIDLAIDLLTLGQYGLECREVPPGRTAARGARVGSNTN